MSFSVLISTAGMSCDVEESPQKRFSKQLQEAQAFQQKTPGGGIDMKANNSGILNRMNKKKLETNEKLKDMKSENDKIIRDLATIRNRAHVRVHLAPLVKPKRSS